MGGRSLLEHELQQRMTAIVGRALGVYRPSQVPIQSLCFIFVIEDVIDLNVCITEIDTHVEVLTPR